jgi:DNA-binding FadR family transcriptional regulator
MNKLFRVERKPKASVEIQRLIINLISQGRLKVGDQLPSEASMAEQMGFSRVPVREAVSGMEHVGLLRVTRGSRGGGFRCRTDAGAVWKIFHPHAHHGQGQCTGTDRGSSAH